MNVLAKILGAVVLVLVLAAVAGIPTYFLWNSLMPEIFGLKTITFWQAVGLNFLTAILFKSPSVSSSSK